MATRAGGRESLGLAGRPLSLPVDAGLTLRCCLLVLAVLATRLPLRTRFLANWDADQFALGLTNFDVIHHQPHPPGYLGYLLLGHLVLPLASDANAGLVILSIAGQAAAAVLLYLWARELFGELAASLSALAFAISPLAWYYAEVANTYALEPVLVLAIAWSSWRAWNGDRGAATWVGAALGVAGAIRPSTAVLMAPLAMVAVARLRDTGLFIRSAIVAAGFTAAWLVPILVVAGGPAPYMAAATALGSDVTASTAIWRAGIAGLQLTTSAVAAGVVWELGGFTVLLVFALVAPLVSGGRAHLGLPTGWITFAALWAVPGLGTFLFIHIGQLVYVQQFTPLLFLLSGPAVIATARALGSDRAVLPLAAGATVASLALFLPLAGQLDRHDRWVAALRADLGRADPETTLLVTDAYAAGSYRTAQVYLPDLRRAGVSVDHQQRLGVIFGDVYEPRGFAAARRFSVPPGVETLVFLDRSTVETYVGDPDLMDRETLPGGDPIYVWHLPPGTSPVVRGHRIWLGDHQQFVERRGLQS